MKEYSKLKDLSLEALSAVISAYPWFGAARKELCMRTGEYGGGQYAEAAMYVASRKKLARAMIGSRADCSDKDVAEILEAYISGNRHSGEKPAPVRKAAEAPVIVTIGGDYFTQSEYETVKKKEDAGLHFRPSEEYEIAERNYFEENASAEDFCTETLAQIYAEQGYYEQAKAIYSKLILAYPEKSAYFAALVKNCNEKIKN